jgi:hypothetical protein
VTKDYNLKVKNLSASHTLGWREQKKAKAKKCHAKAYFIFS